MVATYQKTPDITYYHLFIFSVLVATFPQVAAYQFRSIQHADLLKWAFLTQVNDTGSSEPLEYILLQLSRDRRTTGRVNIARIK